MAFRGIYIVGFKTSLQRSRTLLQGERNHSITNPSVLVWKQVLGRSVSAIVQKERIYSSFVIVFYPKMKGLF